MPTEVQISMQVWLLGSLLLGNKLIDILHKLLSQIGTFLALYSDERVKGYPAVR